MQDDINPQRRAIQPLSSFSLSSNTSMMKRVEEDEESGDEEVKSNTNATVEEHYNKNTCVYQRFNNKDHNEVANQQYFAGLFVHRKIFSDAAFSNKTI